MGYTTFKPFWALGGYTIFLFVSALLGVTGASWSYTLLYESDDLFGFLQCLVFCLSSCCLMILHSLLHFFYHLLLLHTLTFFDTTFELKRSLFVFSLFSFLIDTFYAIKEVESERACRLFFLCCLPMDMPLVTWIMI
jgi:hypothetical protein